MHDAGKVSTLLPQYAHQNPLPAAANVSCSMATASNGLSLSTETETCAEGGLDGRWAVGGRW